ncbi:hypothetical protein CWE12_09665 [Aliidiomarina sedimenti]|uniref:Class I SAM-dependent methyltransferase n=1 Tax=Aliidiomarina sedimenti TaxID=1933879 RepID=A0ABY0BXZ2_9GAMM|nr:class I SAM-dependent methyltransferase [Aliidiomarina sedimenti]RUO29242.1 hypothetical protein CWE12_09665 [Aliidiomarina sedimenti]
MKHTDEATLQYYRDNAEEIFERYEAVSQSGIAEHFSSSFSPGSKVLDVGAGSGRDVRRLLELGFDAYGAEPVEELRDLAISKHPQLATRLFAGTVPNDLPIDQKYDGIICSAVLMHIPPPQLPATLLTLLNLLTVNGRLLISIPASRSDINDKDRDPHGRLFNPITTDKLKALCNKLALKCAAEHVSEDALQRQGTTWYTLLLMRRLQ